MIPTAILAISNVCNLNCKMCRTGREEPAVMSLDILKRIIDKIPNPEVVLAGNGEPLLYPDFLEAISYCKDKITRTVTNGTLLTKELISELADAGLNYMKISLDGNKKIHKQIRPGCDWEMVLQMAIEANRRFPVRIFAMICKKNHKHFDNLLDRLVAGGIKEIDFQGVMERGSRIGWKDRVRPHDIQPLMKKLEELRIIHGLYYSMNLGGVAHECDVPYKQVSIHPNGSVYLCCGGHQEERSHYIGNILEKSYLDIINGPLRMDMIKNLQNKKPASKHCLTCRDWLGG